MKKRGRFQAAIVFSDRGLETLSTIRGDHALGTRVILDQADRIRHFADELGGRARELAAAEPSDRCSGPGELKRLRNGVDREAEQPHKTGATS